MNLNHLYHYHYRPKSYGDQGIDVSGLDYVWATERTFLDNKTGPILTIEDSLGNQTVLNGDADGRIQISDLEAAYAVGGELRVRTFHELKGTGVDATDATFSRQAVLVEANGDVNYLNGAFAPVFKTTNHVYSTSTNIGGQAGLFTTFIGQADFSATGNLCPIGALTFNWMRIEADGDVNMRIRDRDLGGVVIQDTLENNFTTGDQQFSAYLSNRGSSLRMYSNGLTSSVDSSTALEVTDGNLYIGSRGADQFLGHGVFWGAKDGEYSEEDILMAALNRHYFGGLWDDTGAWDDTGIWDGGIELPHPDDLNVSPTFVGLLDTYTGAAAGYSIRQLKASSTLSMRVRRSSDDAEQDIGFDANGDLDTTALTTFVNEDVNQYTSDFSSTEDLSEALGTGAAAQSVGGVDDAYKFTLSGGSGLHQAFKGSGLSGGGTATLSVDYYIPSTNTAVDGMILGLIGGTTQVQSTTDAWTSVILSVTNFGNSNIFFRATDGGSATIDADGDVFYLKNIVVTQTAADGAVTTFYNQTGNGNNATNATSTEQPLVVSGGTLVEENGKAAVDLDGVNDYLTGAAKTTMNNTAIFAVIKSDSNTQDSVFIQNTLDASNCVALGLGNKGSNNAIGSRLLVGGSIIDTAGDSTFTATDQALVSYLADNTAGQMFVDGTEETDAVDSRSGGVATTIGARGDGNNPFNGAFQEVIFFDSDQSSNRTGIETNINDHFSIYP